MRYFTQAVLGLADVYASSTLDTSWPLLSLMMLNSGANTLGLFSVFKASELLQPAKQDTPETARMTV